MRNISRATATSNARRARGNMSPIMAGLPLGVWKASVRHWIASPEMP